MNEPLHLSEQSWKDTETLVHRLESASEELRTARVFYDELVEGLRFSCNAEVVTLSASEDESRQPIARAGIGLYSGSPVEIAASASSPEDPLIQESEQASSVVYVTSPIDSTVELRIDIQFDRPVSLATQDSLTDLLRVLLSFAARVYLRERVTELRTRLDVQQRRDRVIEDLNQGVELQSSFGAIANTLASESSADRVSLVHIRDRNARLIATSTQPHVDERSAIARSLQDLAFGSRQHSELAWPLEAGAGSQDLRRLLDRHTEQSSCKALRLDTICDDGGRPIAAVCREWIRSSPEETDAESSAWNSLQPSFVAAIRRAVSRDSVSSQSMVGRILIHRRKAMFCASAFTVALALLACYPTTLRIPADGRVVASNRVRLFAPAEGVISDVHVGNHQIVDAGQPLIQLTSAALEQTRAEVEGKLATLQAQSAANQASRSSASAGTDRRAARSVTADEKVIRTEISGLERQLDLLSKQQSKLSMASPLRGEIDGWDVFQSLAGRPVARGQHLLDVVDIDGGFHVELELADQLAGYLGHNAGNEDQTVSIRLRSDPTVTHRGVVRSISASTQRDERGQSFVRLRVELSDVATQRFRHGATVIAQIDGPQRSLGFVWMRQLIQWTRENVWL